MSTAKFSRKEAPGSAKKSNPTEIFFFASSAPLCGEEFAFEPVSSDLPPLSDTQQLNAKLRNRGQR